MATKFVVLRPDGEFAEQAAIDTSAGAADAGKIAELDASGVLDPSVLNAATSGVSKVLMTDGSGRIDLSVLPPGVGLDTANIEAGEGLSAGNLVNLYVSGGAFRVRRADASAGRPAHGYVLQAYNLGEIAQVYNEGSNTQVAGLTGERVFLSTTPGGVTNTPPSVAGQIVQRVGTAYSATAFYFTQGRAIYLS